MSGENPMDERSDDPREFMNHPRWHRFIIAIAGPAMNILLAIGLLTIVYMVHYETAVYLDKPAVVDGVRAGSAAAEAGILPGDRIVKIDGIENPTWEQLQPRVWLSPNQPLTVTIQRGTQLLQKTVVPTAVTSSEVGSAGWYPKEAVIVGKLDASMPAAQAGMKEGDRIVALNGAPLLSIENMIEQLQELKDQPLNLTVVRDGTTLDFKTHAVLSTTDDPKEHRYRLGFVNKGETKVTRLPFVDALELSLNENRRDSLMILELAKKIFQHKISMKAVSGPIGIAQDAGYAAQQKGWTPLMELTAAISLNLGIFNLLPIPILDGGVITLLFVEGLMRRDINIRVKERIYQTAFVFLVLFAVMVIFNDLVKTIPGLAQRMP
jgi:regulator of sigma E protease